MCAAEKPGACPSAQRRFPCKQGKYVVFLDADDRLTPNAVAAHLRCFAEHPEAGFVVGDIDQIAVDGSYVCSPRWPILEASHYEELLRVNHVANTIAVMFRRSVIDGSAVSSVVFAGGGLRTSVTCRKAILQRPSSHGGRAISTAPGKSLTQGHGHATRTAPGDEAVADSKWKSDLKGAWREGTRYWQVTFRADRDRSSYLLSPPVRDSGSCIGRHYVIWSRSRPSFCLSLDIPTGSVEITSGGVSADGIIIRIIVSRRRWPH